MTDRASATGQKLTRQEISGRVTGLGWRYNLGLIRTAVKVGSIAQAADVAQAVTALAAQDGDSLSADLRPDRVILTLQSRAAAWVTEREIELAGRISALACDRGLATEAEVGSGAPRSVQVLEIGIDALDIPAIRPFWRAVLGYADEPGGPAGPGAGRPDDIETGLRAALRDAMKTRDVVAVFALRSALGAIGNAGAVPVGPDSAAGAGHPYVAGAAAAPGATDTARRPLAQADLAVIVRREAAERETAADRCDQGGHPDRAERLRREASILRAVLAAG
jgi:Pterin 4 alpha carbinolamine dehydratase